MISMLSLNIERDRHVDAVRGIIREKTPDIICLQEAPKSVVGQIADELGFPHQFAHRTYFPINDDDDAPVDEGVVILWHPTFRFLGHTIHLYNKKRPCFLQDDQCDGILPLLVVTLEKNGEIYRFGVTHFTWTPDGSASSEQREDMGRMLSELATYHDDHGIVFCGDFNAPRGGEIFAMMSERYADHLPPHITTTLDQELHRAPPEERKARAVDSIFSTKAYAISDVEVIGGVSDHMALFAKVSKSVG